MHLGDLAIGDFSAPVRGGAMNFSNSGKVKAMRRLVRTLIHPLVLSALGCMLLSTGEEAAAPLGDGLSSEMLSFGELNSATLAKPINPTVTVESYIARFRRYFPTVGPFASDLCSVTSGRGKRVNESPARRNS